MVEVQFKNTRKGYYLNSTGIPLEIGDMVAVEAYHGVVFQRFGFFVAFKV